jgi:hypothetical protein
VTVAACLAATVVSPPRAGAQEPIDFLGFRPGGSRAVTEQVVRGARGEWSCRGSSVDPRFTECLGRIAPPGEPTLILTASLVHDTVAVLLLSGPVADSDLQRWRTALDDRIGPATVRRSQGQTVWQWVRTRRMVRITMQAGAGTRMASVSLVDGPLLDGLGEPRPRQ